MTVDTHDLVIIGAGPAGMSAALTAAARGLKAVLLDEQPRPGGQIYRNVTVTPPSSCSPARARLPARRGAGRALRGLRRRGAARRPGVGRRARPHRDGASRTAARSSCARRS